MKNQSTKKVVLTGVFSALAFALMFLELSIPIVPSFLKFDISDLPELLATFMLGTPSGVAVCLIKNLLHLTRTGTAGAGELSNFLLGTVLCLSAGLIYRFKRTKGGAIAAMLIGSVVMGLAAFPINTWIIYPLYYQFVVPKAVVLQLCQAIIPSLESVELSILIFNVPFTMCKGLVCSIPTFILYKRLKALFKIT